jgi:hypothetical protein
MSAPIDETARALRHERKRQRLGAADPLCVHCAQGNICCLSRAASGQIHCHNCRKKQKPFSASARRRKLALLAQLGYSDFRCFLCDETDLRVFESHHVAGEANGTLQVPLCMNCHAVQSDDQEDLLGALRLRDPHRRPLMLQAAFEFGVAAILMVLAIATSQEAQSRVFHASLAIVLVAWAVWNLSADEYFVTTYGPEYSRGVPAAVPP